MERASHSPYSSVLCNLTTAINHRLFHTLSKMPAKSQRQHLALTIQLGPKTMAQMLRGKGGLCNYPFYKQQYSKEGGASKRERSTQRRGGKRPT